MKKDIAYHVIKGKTVHQLSESEFKDLVTQAKGCKKKALTAQRAFEIKVLSLGFLFDGDYCYQNKNAPVYLIHPKTNKRFKAPPASIQASKLTRPKNYWTLERCIEQAKNSQTRKEFKESGAARIVMGNKWQDKVYPHLPPSRRRIDKRCIYAITNDLLKLAYVGLTYDFNTRCREHKTAINRPTYDLASHPESVFTQLTDYVPCSEAQRLEAEYAKEYADKYTLINDPSAYGALGCGRRITNKEIKEAALKCKTKSEFYGKYKRLYVAARSRDLLRDKDYFGHMVKKTPVIPHKTTDGENIVTALLYENYKQLKIHNKGCWNRIYQRDLDEKVGKYLRQWRIYHTPLGDFKSSKEAAKAFGIFHGTVVRRCNNESWKAKGWWLETND